MHMPHSTTLFSTGNWLRPALSRAIMFLVAFHPTLSPANTSSDPDIIQLAIRRLEIPRVTGPLWLVRLGSRITTVPEIGRGWRSKNGKLDLLKRVWCMGARVRTICYRRK